MKRERLIKQLMAAKISRNDATAFVKGYHAVKAAGMEHLFKELILPPAPPIRTQTVTPVRFCAKRAVPRFEVKDAGMEKYIKERTAQELACGLLENGVIRVSREDFPSVAIFCAEIWVAPSPEKGGYL